MIATANGRTPARSPASLEMPTPRCQARAAVDFALPAARTALEYQTCPTIYFAPHGPHLLEHFEGVGATGYGVDWRLPLGRAWQRIGL